MEKRNILEKNNENLSEEFLSYMQKKKMSISDFENPNIEILELVCQNTPDFTHGNKGGVMGS